MRRPWLPFFVVVTFCLGALCLLVTDSPHPPGMAESLFDLLDGREVVNPRVEQLERALHSLETMPAEHRDKDREARLREEIARERARRTK